LQAVSLDGFLTIAMKHNLIIPKLWYGGDLGMSKIGPIGPGPLEWTQDSTENSFQLLDEAWEASANQIDRDLRILRAKAITPAALWEVISYEDMVKHFQRLHKARKDPESSWQAFRLAIYTLEKTMRMQKVRLPT
jgi:hypothetical protein